IQPKYQSLLLLETVTHPYHSDREFSTSMDYSNKCLTIDRFRPFRASL
ncbi:26609_t:CDS:2, partial [Dentiscutata erythropus]